MPQDILDVYDTEIEKILTVKAALDARARQRGHNYNDFEREIRDRFAKIGFTVDVNWYKFTVDGTEQDGAMPEITVTGRTGQDFAFDPDRQVHEVTHNVLGIPGQEGVIRTDPATVKQILERNGHGHGHSR